MDEAHQFRPFRLFTGKHTQTIIGTMFSFAFEPQSETRYIDLPDGDQIAIEVTTPEGWTPDRPTVCMLHGLCGSHRSTYLVRMANKLARHNIRSIRMNMRGCGSGKGKARNIYHSGCSHDFKVVLEKLHEETPDSPITLIGFSLGGNIVLKLAGELSVSDETHLIHHVISVSPPVDLNASVELLDHPENGLYARYFMHHLLAEIDERRKLFPDVEDPKLPKELNFKLFEELYIAPNAGFASQEDYHMQCSAAPLVSKITVPCHILFAKDDPIISCKALDPYHLPSNVHVTITNHGGHMGFIGSPLDVGGFHWMDTMLMKWMHETTGVEF